MEAAEVIKKFLANSSWVQEAKAFINDKEKMQNLLNRFKEFLIIVVWKKSRTI